MHFCHCEQREAIQGGVSLDCFPSRFARGRKDEIPMSEARCLPRIQLAVLRGLLGKSLYPQAQRENLVVCFVIQSTVYADIQVRQVPENAQQ